MSTKTRARFSAASSASRIRIEKAPTRSRCWPAFSQAPATSGVCESVAQEMMSAVAHGVLQPLGRMRAEALRGQALRQPMRALRAVVPHRDRFDRPLAGVGAGEERRERAGADEEQGLRVGAREMARRQRRGGGGAPQRQPRSVHGGERRAGDAGLQDVEAEHGRQAARRIAGKDVDDLHAEKIAGAGAGLVQAGISNAVAAGSPARSISW